MINLRGESIIPTRITQPNNDYPVAVKVSKICYWGIVKRLLTNIRFQSVK